MPCPLPDLALVSCPGVGAAGAGVAHRIDSRAAVSSQCDYIVTHNTADFKGTEKFGIQVLTPGEFLKTIDEG